MPTAENAKIQIEDASQTFHDYAVMTDSGDQTVFTISGGTIWSNYEGKTPSVRPNGISVGNNLLSVHADDDKVTIAAFKAYSKGTEQDVSATTATFTRPATANRAKVYSVTMASDGSISVVAGTISDDTSFSSTRDASGGPPLIPGNSVELGQIRVTEGTSGALTSSEIFQTIGTHTESAFSPMWTENPIGDGDAADSSYEENAFIEFSSALPKIHTGTVCKKIYIAYYEPSFETLQIASDFTPAEETHSVSSTQMYRKTVASTSKTLNQGGFTVNLNDGVTDSIIRNKDKTLTVKFYPDEDESPYILTQGKIGLSRSFPADGQISATVTISAESKSAEFSS